MDLKERERAVYKFLRYRTRALTGKPTTNFTCFAEIFIDMAKALDDIAVVTCACLSNGYIPDHLHWDHQC